MNTKLPDAEVLTNYIINHNEEYSNIDLVLCPPYLWIYKVSEMLNGKKNIFMGSQNLSHETDGASTGEISAEMLSGLVKYSIVGHSERRANFFENVGIINKKIRLALDNKIRPIICIGERQVTVKSKDILMDEIKELLSDVKGEEMHNVVLVYEPVWAISSNDGSKPADGAYVANVIATFRENLTKLFSREVANHTKILYGGSVDAENAEEFLSQPGVDGIMVGSASLKGKEFLKICEIANNK
jgi:triosephosphate isomerase